jgi:DNA modification methylase
MGFIKIVKEGNLEVNKILNIDCREGFKPMQDNSIHLIVTSPPYFNVKEYSHWDTYQDYIEWLKDVFCECFRVLKEGRMCCVNLSAIIQPRAKRSEESKRIPLPFHFVNLMEGIGFKFLEDIIWVKPEGAVKNRNGRFSLDRQPVQYKPNVVNEYILVFQKPMKGLIDKIVRSYKGEVKKKSLIENGYERTNVWYMNPETNGKHPAPYPEELSDKCIKYYSYVNDIVLDPFMGWGTTAISSLKLNRKYIGFELHSEYCQIAEDRIVDYKNNN